MRRGRSGLKAVDATDDSVAHMGDIEIQKITQFEAAQTQVAQELTAMDGQGRFDGFDLDNDRIFHQQVDTVSVVDEETPLSKWD
jgi:hypothetical protein